MTGVRARIAAHRKLVMFIAGAGLAISTVLAVLRAQRYRPAATLRREP